MRAYLYIIMYLALLATAVLFAKKWNRKRRVKR